MSEIELKPCPFCGNKYVRVIEYKNTKMFTVWCPECKTEGWVDLGESGAIEGWNKRPIEDTLRTQLAASQAEAKRLRETNRAMKEQLDIATDLGEKRFRECEALRKALEKIAEGHPPADWEYYSSFWGYRGHGNQGDPDYVASVDESNSGDMHDHGWACGEWAMANLARAALATRQAGDEHEAGKG